ncbi:lycopene cyclase family protein [Cesiribacter sp. SM1]|uniref:lycopene cyclase family protein n=1 Tax=Cesiribacter sp. SM1 TaxID=2861196 RepID=UPI001CD329B3|nr:lycopene cyclase family protein [Cesiribacter sp. SM1]
MANQQQYDFIIAGAGAAGLSLAWHLTHSPKLREKQILLIDRSAKTENDRTWGYWAKGAEPFDDYVSWQFKDAEFFSRYYTDVISLAPYSYRVLEGRRFYEVVRGWLGQFPNVHWLQTSIEGFDDTDNGAFVYTGAGSFRAPWIFNSCFLGEALKKAAQKSISLRQHFKGWVIDTSVPAFQPNLLRLFDFRTPQQGCLRFFYLIPQSPTRALVEYTLFSDSLLAPAAYEQELKRYIREVLQLNEYSIVEEEWGVIPMTTYSFPKNRGQHILNIGSVGGASKPSTGYTFRRIQQQCSEIVQLLEEGKRPLPESTPLRHRLYDATMLNILDRQGDEGEAVFARLFEKNPVQRLFKFLDEETNVGEELLLMQTVNKPLFLLSMLNLTIKHA